MYLPSNEFYLISPTVKLLILSVANLAYDVSEYFMDSTHICRCNLQYM